MYNVCLNKKKPFLIKNYPSCRNLRPNRCLFDSKSNYIFSKRLNQKLQLKYDGFFTPTLETSFRERMYLVKTGLP